MEEAQKALDGGRFSDAVRILNRALAKDPGNALLWALRGDAAAGLQDSEDAVNAWVCALRAAAPGEKPALEARISAAARDLLAEDLQRRASVLLSRRTPQAFDDLIQTKASCVRKLNTLIAQTSLPVAAGMAGADLTRILYETALAVYSDAAAAFGPAYGNMLRWQWETYTELGDGCLRLLEEAVFLCRDGALGKSVCDLYIRVGEALAGSRAYKRVDAGVGQERYEPDRAFTEHAKRLRRESVQRMDRIRGYFETDQIARLISELAADRAEADARRGTAAYWRDRPAEKQKLLSERAALRAQAQNALLALKRLPCPEAAPVRRAEKKLRDRIDALGPLRLKEKKELKRRLKALSVLNARRETERAREKAELEWTLKKARARVAEINRIFSAPRAPVPAAPGALSLPGAIENGRFTAAANRIRRHLAAVLPAALTPEPPRPTEQAPIQPPAAFFPTGGGRYCAFGKPAADAPAADRPLLFFQETDRQSPIDGLLLLCPSAVQSEETLHDAALIASLLLLAFCDEIDQPAAERAAILLRHSRDGDAAVLGSLLCRSGFADAALPDGRAVPTEYLYFTPLNTPQEP